MTDIKTCNPILINTHPLPGKSLAEMDLPSMRDVFTDFRKAAPGLPVGLQVTVTHNNNNILNATGPASLLLSQGPGQIPLAIGPREAIRQPDLLNAMDIALYAPSVIQEIENVRWIRGGWQSSSNMDGYHLRSLWIFPRAALLMDNIHSCYIDLVSELTYLSLVMHEDVRSNHEALDLSAYINGLLAIAATEAIPKEVIEWPEEAPPSRIPFAEITSSNLISPRQS